MIKKLRLEITVFMAGAVVMLVELTGSRILAPYVGTSIYVWTNLIGVIMISLSLGYWWGGRLARVKTDYQTLAKILFWSGLCVGATYLFHEPLLNYIQKYFTSLKAGAFLASLVLFAPSSVLLGMISPYAVSLKVKDIKLVGVEVGNLYAISTVGSIVGTFLTGYILIAMLGSSMILGLAAVVLLALSVFNYADKRRVSGTAMAGVMLVSGGWFGQATGVVDVDTQYSRVRIVDTQGLFGSQKARVMFTGNTMSSGVLENGQPAFPYIRFYRVAKYFNPQIDRALVIGGAGYTLPIELMKSNPEMKLDVIEIDPELTVLAEKYFGLKRDEHLRVYHEDGRTFINRTRPNSYDAIYIDAFGSYTPPFQLTTKEVVQKMYQGLNDNGVVLVNIISTLKGDKGKLLRAQYRTYAQVFPHVYVFPVTTRESETIQNIMLVASKNKQVEAGDQGEYWTELSKLWAHKLADDVVVLTDDFAPVEAYGESFF